MENVYLAFVSVRPTDSVDWIEEDHLDLRTLKQIQYYLIVYTIRDKIQKNEFTVNDLSKE